MRKLVEFSKKHELAIRFIIALFVSLLFMAGSFLWGSYIYETNDDETMNFIAAGAYGKEYSQYLIFSNIIYGYLLKGLYYIFPGINCYLATMLGLDVLAFTFLTIALAKRFSIEGLFTVSVLINALLTPRFYAELQFTKNASLYAVVGFLVYLMFVKTEPDRKAYYRCMRLIGMAFMMLSVLVRWQCFFLILPIAGITYLFQCLYLFLKKDNWKECVHLRELACFALVVIALLGLQKLAYSSEEWKEYQKYYAITARILDYGDLQYDTNQEEVGVHPIEIDMIKRWDWADFDNYDLSHLGEIAEAKEKSHTGAVSLKNVWYTILEANAELLCVWLIVAIITITITKSKLLVFQQISFGALSFIYYGYFTHLYRAMERVILGVWLAFIIYTIAFGVYTLETETVKVQNTWLIATMIIVVVLGKQYKNYDLIKGKQYVETMSYTSTLLNSMHEDDESLYFLDPLTFGGAKTDNLIILDARYKDYYNNMFMLGGWMLHSPAVNHEYEECGIRNPFDTMLQNENAYYVGDMKSLEDIQKYYNDVQNKQIKTQLVQEFNQIYIWKLSEE